ncbi:MAG: hypothetical protein QXO22_07600 [Thermosphaera sp.]
MSYRVRVVVKEVKGFCASGFKLGDEFVVKKFYVPPQLNMRIHLHALVGMSSLLLPLLKGVSARELGIGTEDDVGYVQCPILEDLTLPAILWFSS